MPGADYPDMEAARPLPPLPELPRVSIYMTAYQHEAFVEEAVESVLAQGWPRERLQFVVIDDGSTDRTAEKLARYRDRATIVTQANRGLRGAVNRGMEMLEGDVITSISGDDVWPEGRLRALVDALRANPRAGLVYSDLEIVDAAGAREHPSFMAASALVPRTGRICGPLLRNNFVSGGGCMQRGCLKAHVHPIRGGAPWEDWWWAWALASVSEVTYLPETTCRYRLHGNNLSLGRGGDAVAEARAAELPFRRWMLRQVEPGTVTAHDANAGLRVAASHLADLADRRGCPPQELMPVGAGDRAAALDRLADAEAALARGDVEAAVVAAVAGWAADPFDTRIGELLSDHGAEAVVNGPPLLLRRFITVADADEVVARPELLAAYARRFGAGDDATLVIHGRGWDDDRLATQLAPLLGDADADVLATADPPYERTALLHHAHALLGEWCPHPSLVSYGVDRVPALHATAAAQLAAA